MLLKIRGKKSTPTPTVIAEQFANEGLVSVFHFADVETHSTCLQRVAYDKECS